MTLSASVADQLTKLRQVEITASDLLETLCHRIGFLEHSWLEHMLVSLRATYRVISM